MIFHIFDWNGNLAEDLKKDEAEYNITLEIFEGPEMGFYGVKAEGCIDDLVLFMEFYELEEG